MKLRQTDKCQIPMMPRLVIITCAIEKVFLGVGGGGG